MFTICFGVFPPAILMVDGGLSIYLESFFFLLEEISGSFFFLLNHPFLGYACNTQDYGVK